MTKRMLIDSTHAEETRVVVLDGNRLEDFDVETSTKQQLKGNIYLAKVVRVEPSLQAAFVEYGGGRHGFLAFGEIHPDYYQIPVADRQRLLEMQEAEAREDEEAEDRAAAREARTIPITSAPDAPIASADPATLIDRPDVMEAITGASYAVQADPEAMDEALPRPDQVAQAAAISQDILVAPEQAEALFPEPDAEPAAAIDPEPVFQPQADVPLEVDAPGADVPDADAQKADAEELDADEPGADMAPEAGMSPADFGPDAGDLGASDPGAGDGIDLGPFDGPGLDAAALSETASDPVDAVPFDDTPIDAGPAPETILQAVGLDQPSDAVFDAEPPPEMMGGETEEPREQRAPPRFLRNYKIQEVIRRRQILLIQVVKEERGSKGAALTTYISLAGRFSVLMPNSPRGGGISRKITSATDRRRLKEVTAELDLPRGMGLIVRTAGANRPKPEIIRDCEYLLNQWDQIRDLTMKSMAPALIYEEASLIKRAIRDVYSRDVDDILVDGEDGWRAARDFMRMLMPTHARKVQLWRDPQPLFVKAQVEAQLDAMLVPTVQLKSGGYLVINQTEALVAIDVNSGRSTRERGIEETALKTNLEAADEAARQLRLRDLAGLIVIDFIDMESRRNNTAVEARLKNALKNDRARIQVGSISHFGLLEMSRQRLRPSLAETSFVMCPHCAGTGQVRSTESAALHVLRGVEEEGAKRRAAEVIVHVAGSIALYVLNHKRVRLAEIEARYGMKVAFAADDSLLPPNMRIDRVRALAVSEAPAPVSQLAPPEPFEDPDEEPMDVVAEAAGSAEVAGTTGSTDDIVDGDDDEAPRPGETAAETEQRSKRRRRRRRGGRREDGPDVAAASPVLEDAGQSAPDTEAPAVDGAVMDALIVMPSDDDAPTVTAPAAEDADAAGDDADRSKRRGRRGGRRRRREPGEAAVASDAPDTGAAGPDTDTAGGNDTSGDVAATQYAAPAYAGPTPANPFGGTSAFDIFDAIEQAEQERTLAATTPARPAVGEEEPAPSPDDSLPVQQVPEPIIAEPVALAPETVSLADPVPVADPVEPPEATATEPVIAEPVDPVPELVSPELALPEPALAPVIQPVLIDGADPTAEKKRGWWRR